MDSSYSAMSSYDVEDSQIDYSSMMSLNTVEDGLEGEDQMQYQDYSQDYSQEYTEGIFDHIIIKTI